MSMKNIKFTGLLTRKKQSGILFMFYLSVRSLFLSLN